MRDEMREKEADSWDPVEELVLKIGTPEMFTNAMIKFAGLKLAGKDPKVIIENTDPEAFQMMQAITEDSRDDAMKLIGFLLSEHSVFAKGIALAILKKIVEPLTRRIADLERTNETLNVALANKEAN